MMSRRSLIGAAFGGVSSLVAPGCGNGAAHTPADSIFAPESFGAKGDGVTNDSAAFAAMASVVNLNGGGIVALRPTTYLVGGHMRARDGYAYHPVPLMQFTGCTKPLILQGNNAVLRCAPGLRFGTFDARSGEPTRHKQPFYELGELSSPYWWMIKAEKCSDIVEISDLELDGNVRQLSIGGPWGDSGHQIMAHGIGLYNNSGPEILRNIHAHHHPLDGLIIDGLDEARDSRSSISGLRAEYNGRQGCSIVGGRGYDFEGCKFNHTGRAGLASAPGAGVDIEAEEKKIRDITFRDCEFIDNAGPGMLADSGDSEQAHFERCNFVGTTSWSAWPRKPEFRFRNCTFVGCSVHAFGDKSNPQRAAQFAECSFTDDPSLSPSGSVYGGADGSYPIADLSSSSNALFNRCIFRLDHAGTLPWSVEVIYADCRMTQKSNKESYPKGTYIGRNSIKGRVVLSGSKVSGVLIVNGSKIPPGKV